MWKATQAASSLEGSVCKMNLPTSDIIQGTSQHGRRTIQRSKGRTLAQGVLRKITSKLATSTKEILKISLFVDVRIGQRSAFGSKYLSELDKCIQHLLVKHYNSKEINCVC